LAFGGKKIESAAAGPAMAAATNAAMTLIFFIQPAYASFAVLQQISPVAYLCAA
jgi:hypothetical protein